MNSEKLKLKIFQKVDLLDNQKLEEIYGLISNHINGEIDLSDLNKLAKEEQLGLDEAIESINKGEFLSHENVITELRNKYA
jgi:hypothetical protein